MLHRVDVDVSSGSVMSRTQRFQAAISIGLFNQMPAGIPLEAAVELLRGSMNNQKSARRDIIALPTVDVATTKEWPASTSFAPVVMATAEASAALAMRSQPSPGSVRNEGWLPACGQQPPPNRRQLLRGDYYRRRNRVVTSEQTAATANPACRLITVQVRAGTQALLQATNVVQ
jgi:hypothetical protein